MPSPKIIADLRLQLAAKTAVGATSATLSADVDSDGVALPTGTYYFTIDSGNSNKEYITCTKTGTALTSIKTVSRQGIETSGMVYAHNVAAPVIMTDFATYKTYIDEATIAGVSPATTTTLGGVYTTTNTASSVVVSTDDSRLTAAALAVAVGNLLFPVNSIYTALVSTNPATLLGFGTWSAFGSGRVLIGAGTGTVVATFASRASNVITVTGLTNAVNNEFQTGQAVLYTAAAGAMTGLTHNTTYYLIRTGNLTFSLATTLALAQAGTAIALSSDGTGTQTFTLTLTARTAGDTGGEENHAMSSTELLAHKHTLIGYGNAGSDGFQLTTRLPGVPNALDAMNNAGGNAAMNNMQPFITVYMWKRTA